MLFEYLGYAVYRLAISSYLVTGPGFRGYVASESEAIKIIDGVIAWHWQCEE